MATEPPCRLLRGEGWATGPPLVCAAGNCWTGSSPLLPKVVSRPERRSLTRQEGSPAVFPPPAPGRCPRRRSPSPASMVAPPPTVFPPTFPAALLGVGNLLVGQGLDCRPDGNRSSLNAGCCEQHEGCCAKSHQKTAHGRVLHSGHPARLGSASAVLSVRQRRWPSPGGSAADKSCQTGWWLRPPSGFAEVEPTADAEAYSRPSRCSRSRLSRRSSRSCLRHPGADRLLGAFRSPDAAGSFGSRQASRSRLFAS
jgi:hypothetical protein